ncbi:MAG TPA: helicase C-terminal domain-containing protein [Opitutaceae bacterium]|nr:helicase C-terminal domain-containing protein [Opitutaceae bacterium]
MHFSLDDRTASLSVGEFAGFTLGPREDGDGASGLWRAQLGQHWHNELRKQTSATDPTASFEIPITAKLFHGGWTLEFAGRIDQRVDNTLREIKTVSQALPAAESDLRADYPAYFIQIATYAALIRARPEIGDRRSDVGAQKQEAPNLLPVNSEHPLNFSDAPTSDRRSPSSALRAELVFVEAGIGLTQTIALTPADDALFTTQLARLVEFLNARHRARERIRALRFRSPFTSLRPGQETIQEDLAKAWTESPVIFFEAPTGFGKTGVLLEAALNQLKVGHCSRIIYLTSKSTGQLQVVRTLEAMTAPSAGDQRSEVGGQLSAIGGSALSSLNLSPETRPTPSAPNSSLGTHHSSLPYWHVRNKGEHCVNSVFHCVRSVCGFLEGAAGRWPKSGLSRFVYDENQPRDMVTLREAGREARICPYEITRTALAFNDVWIGDYNYVFASRNRTLFFEQPGFDPAETLLVIDEAHNLPSRVADAYSHELRASDTEAVLSELDHLRAPRTMMRAWESLTKLVSALTPCETLSPALEDDLSECLATLTTLLSTTMLDHAALGPYFSDVLWRSVELDSWMRDASLEKLLWVPNPGELRFTCLDAAPAIGSTLKLFGGLILSSATLSPLNEYAESIGLGASAPKSEQPRSEKSSLALQVLASRSPETLNLSPAAGAFVPVRAQTPWRDGAYDVAIDLRVDTRYAERSKYQHVTAATVEALYATAQAAVASSRFQAQGAPDTFNHEPGTKAVAAFFPSYRYAESIRDELEAQGSVLRVALQPRLNDLAAQAAWVEESLAFSDVLFLVLGSSFAEGIDLLGGRVGHAMVVGPALPEVNAVQKARVARQEASSNRATAFRRVYQIPGLQRVNQALGRLVRAPGQRAKILLHCRRFAEVSYASLLAPDYQFGMHVTNDGDLAAWLNQPAS